MFQVRYCIPVFQLQLLVVLQRGRPFLPWFIVDGSCMLSDDGCIRKNIFTILNIVMISCTAIVATGSVVSIG